MHRPGIYLIRPQTLSDPSLIKIDGEFLLPKVSKALLWQKILTEVVVCIPESIPGHIKELLGTWDLPLIIANAEFPAARLNEVIHRYDYDIVACFIAYNYLISGAAVKTAFQMVTGKEADFVYPSHVITAKHFSVMNRAAIKRLCAQSHLPLPPNRFHQKLEENPGDLRVLALNNLESAGERFLWDLYYVGEREIIPEKILKSHFKETAREQWFDPRKFKALLANDLHIENWDWLDEYLSDNTHVASQGRSFAAQFSWYRRWQKYLPTDKERFFEIGFGNFPITSFLLLNRIRTGLALEPCGYSAQGVSQALNLCDLLDNKIPSLFSWDNNNCHTLGRASYRLQLANSQLEKMVLPGNSFDFCFSKTVFEHVMDVESLSREMYRLMRPGSTMIHEIDFSDHSDGSTVHFSFLKYSKADWLQMQQTTNLWRINDYIELWEKLGFRTKVLSMENTQLNPPVIHNSWHDYSEEDLLCHTAVIRAVREG